MQYKHNSTLIIKSSQNPIKNQDVNPPGSKTSRSTRPMGRLWSFFLKLSGYYVISQLSRLEHSELVLGPFENLTNLGPDPLLSLLINNLRLLNYTRALLPSPWQKPVLICYINTYRVLNLKFFKAEGGWRTLTGLASLEVDGSKVQVATDLHFAETVWDPVQTREDAVRQMEGICLKN